MHVISDVVWAGPSPLPFVDDEEMVAVQEGWRTGLGESVQDSGLSLYMYRLQTFQSDEAPQRGGMGEGREAALHNLSLRGTQNWAVEFSAQPFAGMSAIRGARCV